MKIVEKLKSLNIDISQPPKAVGSYSAFKIVNKFIYISGQLPIKKDGSILKGKVGDDITLEEAQKAAGYCAVNIISQLNSACSNDLELVKNCIKINGYVNSSNTFFEQPKVINPVSELIVNIFGDKGSHARAAVSVNSLPLGASVEVDAIFEIN
jgi:enamine deaminase RidA (YjgF/YER057c/UK114 family)